MDNDINIKELTLQLIVSEPEISCAVVDGGSIACVRSVRSGIDLAAWSRAHRAWIDAQLLQSGSILFRGFDVPDPTAFSAAAHAISGDLFADYGDLPRNAAGEKIYESTPYRTDERILFHNESSHASSWPMRIHFYCVTPASRGGCTPIIDTRKIVELLDPEIVAEFDAKGLLYVRNFIEGVDPTWQRFFGTSDRAIVEERCRQRASVFSWRSDGGLTVRDRTRAISTHPVTGERIFFNQLQLHHISCLDEDAREGLLALFDYDELPRNVYFGDGTPISDDIMHHIGDVYDRISVRFAWERNDVIVLDNMLTSHGRDSYEGDRKILVALAQVVDAQAGLGTRAGAAG